jgi:hypothetical protein
MYKSEMLVLPIPFDVFNAAAEQVVQHSHVHTVAQEPANQMATDETCSTSHQDPREPAHSQIT